MTGASVVAAALVVLAALLVGFGRRDGVLRRLRVLVPAEARVRPVVGTGALSVRAVAVLAGLAVFLLAPGPVGAAVGLAAGFMVDRALRRLEPAAVRRERAMIAAELPFASDLLGAVLRAGAPVGSAVTEVGAAVGGPLGALLCKVGALHRLGAPATEAWAVLGAVAETAPLLRSAVRASDSGAALAVACERLAAELRARSSSALDARARRAEVLGVLPLALCQLPAFVLLGVVPVAVGVLDAVLR